MTEVIKFHDEKMTRIWDRLYLGCFYDAIELKFHNPKEITAVLNCTPDPIHFGGTVGHDIKSHQIQLWHDGFAIKESEFWKAMQWVMGMQSNGEKVLVHCHAGMSRSPSMAAAYMYLVGFEQYDKALDYIKLVRPIIQPNIEVTNSIKRHLEIWPYDGTYDGK